MQDVQSQTGCIVSVNVSVGKGTSKHPVPEIVITAQGVAGDAHAGEWHRQVSLLAIESIRRFADGAGREFRCGDFAENVTTEGIDTAHASVLDRFTIGAVELEVTQLGKACHGDGCAIYQEVGQCVMPKEGVFCRVIQGGTVKPGDIITYAPRLLRIHVITLSDRASRGVYEDRSGPRVQERLDDFSRGKRWHTHVERTVLPDDAGLLRRALETARNAHADVIFTTGGTGIGPRDVTPDVVAALANKIIPGVMEHIRVKFGADKPNALISRSVAAVLGQTLIYTLPGSVRAVDEYLDEILKTLEHSIYMLHGLDAH